MRIEAQVLPYCNENQQNVVCPRIARGGLDVESDMDGQG